MNQQPDKFFREKLEDYNKPAPSAAWDKIAAAQPKKNHKGLVVENRGVAPAVGRYCLPTLV